MTMPINFPDWMPWWLQLLVVAAVLLLGVAFAMMPFSVFGLKGRLDEVDSRLDEIQSELRSLVLRLPDPGREPYDVPAVLRASAPLRDAPKPPPIPPASWQAEPVRDDDAVRETGAVRESLSPTLRAAARVSEAARDRAEPRLARPKPTGL